MSLFANAKDRLMEQAALSFLNSRLLTPFGRATQLRIDSKAKQLSIELELNGESAPVRLELADYEIQKEDDRSFIIVRKVTTSREWLTALATNQFCGRRIELPPAAAPWVAKLL